MDIAGAIQVGLRLTAGWSVNKLVHLLNLEA